MNELWVKYYMLIINMELCLRLEYLYVIILKVFFFMYKFLKKIYESIFFFL